MTLAWIAAALCVGLMGFAIQRGGTCTVAAIDELVNERRARRLLAMFEASLWVAGGLALAQLLHLAGSMPAGAAVDGATIGGGLLLGLGAWVNRACVFGAIARLGSGQWAYAFTPLGFYSGCLSAPLLFGRRPATAAVVPSPLMVAATVAAPLFIAYAAWRIAPTVAAMRGAGRLRLLTGRVWSPHAATIVIGVSFVVTWLLAGRWAYTDLLADLAHGMAGDLARRALLFAALLIGAMLGGWTAGRWQREPIEVSAVARCLAGGLLMGWGGLLIPGSNDGLILVGLPLLQPHAWLAFATMCATIALAMRAQRQWQVPSGA
ncbi:MAG: YeeE/YedE thiosulfate transporter family protein [Burkholderiales bacterium]